MNVLKRVIIILLSFLLTSPCCAGEIGVASYYGDGEVLNPNTAMNIPFCADLLEGASYKYKLGTVVKVTNLSNNKSVIIRITDKGPNRRLNRIIDLTKYAFSRIESLDKGLCKVEIEVVGE